MFACFTWDDPIWLVHYSTFYPINLFGGILWLISFSILRFIRKRQNEEDQYMIDNYKY